MHKCVQDDQSLVKDTNDFQVDIVTLFYIKLYQYIQNRKKNPYEPTDDKSILIIVIKGLMRLRVKSCMRI